MVLNATVIKIKGELFYSRYMFSHAKPVFFPLPEDPEIGVFENMTGLTDATDNIVFIVVKVMITESFFGWDTL